MKEFLIQQLRPCNIWLCVSLTSRASEQWLGQCWTPSSGRELTPSLRVPLQTQPTRIQSVLVLESLLLVGKKNKNPTNPNFAVSFTNPEALGLPCWRPSAPMCSVPSWPRCPWSCRRSKLQGSPPCKLPEIQPGWQQTSPTRFRKLLRFLLIWQWFLSAF